MKKRLYLLSLSALVLLAACGKQDDSASNAVASEKEEVSQTPDKKSAALSLLKQAKDALQDDEVRQSIRDTLQLASSRAVEAYAGAKAKESMAVALPESFDGVTQALNKAGQKDLVQDFNTSISKAAGGVMQASPDIFNQVIAELPVPMSDALAVLKGGDSAATDYLRNNARSMISTKLMPVVKAQIDEYGVGGYLDKIKEFTSGDDSGLMSGLQQMTGVSIPKDFSLDGFIVDEVLDTLFVKMAEQEKLIRQDPVGQGSALIQKAMSMME